MTNNNELSNEDIAALQLLMESGEPLLLGVHHVKSGLAIGVSVPECLKGNPHVLALGEKYAKAVGSLMSDSDPDAYITPGR